MKKILGAIQDLPANQHSQFSPIPQIMAELAGLVSWQILKGSQDFLHTFSMVLYYKWNIKNSFACGLQFFSLISDGLGGVRGVYIYAMNDFMFKIKFVKIEKNNLNCLLKDFCFEIHTQKKNIANRKSTFYKVDLTYNSLSLTYLFRIKVHGNI